MAFGKHAAVRRRRQSPTRPSVAAQKHLARLATTAQAEFFECDELVDRIGIVDLSDIDVSRAYASFAERLLRRLRPTEAREIWLLVQRKVRYRAAFAEDIDRSVGQIARAFG